MAFASAPRQIAVDDSSFVWRVAVSQDPFHNPCCDNCTETIPRHSIWDGQLDAKRAKISRVHGMRELSGYILRNFLAEVPRMFAIHAGNA
jgi:hypothetical protein